MGCLIDYIGLRGCSVSEPDSGMWINSLAGITGEILELAADKEQKTGRLAWDDIQEVAWRRFYSDSITALRKKYTLKQVREFFRFTPELGGTVEAAANEKRGVLLQFAFYNFTFQSFTLGKIFIVAQANTPDVVINVLDRNGNVLYTRTKDLLAGLNTIVVDRTFVADTIFVSVDAVNIDTQESNLLENNISCFCQVVQCYCQSCTPSISGHIYAGDQYTKTGTNTHGIGLEGFVGCDYTSLICNNKELFSAAWLFLLGNQSIVELLNSNRINKPTTVDRERYTQLRDFYQVEYEKQLASAVEGFALNPDNDCCLECAQPIRRVQWMP